jgi:DNA-binding transcriptional LysR family regulator
MELRHLKSFLAVAEGLSFTRAAEKLHLSQPALSARIQELESNLGVTLLERSRRSVRLTPAGLSFQRDASEILHALQDAERRAQMAAAGEAGNLRIGFVASAGIDLVPSIVLAFRKRYPLVTLELMNVRTVDQIARLAEGSLDAGFLRLPAAHADLEILPIHHEPFVLTLPLSHPLADAEGVIDPKKLRSENFLAYGRRWAPEFFDRWISIFEHVGFTPRIVQETGEMWTLLALVSAGVGIAVVPRGLARKSGSPIAIRALPLRSPLSAIGLAYRVGDNNPLLRRLRVLARTMGKQASSV